MTDETSYIIFANRLKEYRQEKGISQVDLAKELEVPANTYNQYEKGTRKVPLSFIRKVANYYRLTIDELIGLDPTDPHPSSKPMYGEFIEKIDSLNLTKEDLSELVKYAEFLAHKKGE